MEQVVTVGGTVVDRQTEDLPAPDGLNLVQGGLAYVGDYSFFGFTSPINGRRFRFEAQPTVGTLQYLTILTDYRKYFFWNPFTMAFRAYHYGRYFLNEEENNRLTPLFIGYETFVRGYNFGSFTNSECSEGDSPGDCPEFDRLLGSRIGVFNAEFRFPLFGTEQFGLINFPYLPTELALFFDGGVAWTADESPEFKLKEKSKERIPVFSTGMAVRVNLFGALVGQVYYAIPFQRPQKDGLFGFVIALGW
ncbi:MAG: BamA/TamA family outer membrane protein [Aliifodinibius sp.]|nr:BamA/TamA family outer membrane protein [Fodinibius sp.]NIW43459.1 BamA/TamA family outer membrane protein [Gammaproteobacteria bacterium]NIW97583.1 BamA/TamA family outer membrane protein [Phycisphaerae bacterium]NIY23667.1 BamA/TamA family outer membrane protein [Fodinibius sp.]